MLPQQRDGSYNISSLQTCDNAIATPAQIGSGRPEADPYQEKRVRMVGSLPNDKAARPLLRKWFHLALHIVGLADLLDQVKLGLEEIDMLFL